MIKMRWIALIIALIAVINKADAQNPELVDSYIKQYRELAMSEQARVGIPAAVTLAQGIHETGAGTSRLATLGNNHFGIKCKREWKGQTIKHTDDAPNECFRKYSHPIESYKDHSDYLRNNPRYASLFKLSITDYAAWCIGLRRAGYATNPRYAQVLIKLIEDYKLQEYTYAAMGNNSLGDVYVDNRENEIIPDNYPEIATTPTAAATPVTSPVETVPVVTKTVSSSGIKVSEQRTLPTKEAPTANHPPYGEPIKVNGLRAVYGKEGQAPLEYAIKNSIRYKRFLELNDLDESVLPQDMYLYLERKHFRGVRPMHMVKPGENMHVISQKEGIQLKYLRELNYMLPGEEPVPGIVLELQNKAKVKPRVYEAPQKEVARQNINTTPAGYVSTSKSPIPTNPRYVAPSKDDTSNVAPVVANADAAPEKIIPTEKPIYKPQEVVKETNKPSEVKNEISEDDNIAALKKKFDNVIYSKEPGSETVSTNPRYVPQDRNVNTITKTVTIPVENTTVTETTTTIPQPVAKENNIEPTKQEQISKTPVVKEVDEKEKKIVIPIISKLKKSDKETNQEEKKNTSEPQQEVVEEPKSELDKLKAQFDAVVYDNPNQKKELVSKPVQKASTSETSEKKEVEDPTKYYTVKEGDTAFSIAKKHNISMTQLMDWNNLDFDAIKVGMKLKVKQ